MKTKNSRKLFSLSICLLCLILPAFAFGEGTDKATHFDGWQTVGPNGGDVRAIVVDPRDKNHYYISTLDGQVYSSNDGGKSWQLKANLNRPQLILDQLIIDPRDSNVIYTSGHRHKEPGGFFKTTDGGVTWKEAKELKNESIHSMVQSSKDPNLMMVGTIAGIWISNNSGDDWKKIDSETIPINVDSLAIDPNDTNIVYAGTWWRAYKTIDAGKTWKLIKDGMIDDSDVFAIDIDPRNADHVIASACSGIYESFNKGELWKKIQGIPSQSRRTRAIVQNPGLPGAVYAGTTEGFWMTTDSGKSWTLTTSRQLEINSIAVHPDQPNKIMVATNNFGVMVSEDGGKNFTATNGSFSSRLTYSIVADVERPARLYATTINTAKGGGFIFASDDDGATWQPSMKNFPSSGAIPYSFLQSRKNPNIIYLATNNGLYQSADRGASWKQLTTPAVAAKRVVKKSTTKSVAKTPAKIAATAAPTIPEATANQPHVKSLTDKINSLAFTDDGKEGILAGTAKGLYRTYDVGKGWDKIPFGSGLDEQVYSIFSSAQQPDRLWVGTASSGLIVSNDNGKTWEKVAGIPEAIPVVAITSSPQRPENIFVGTTQTLYLSRDGGKTFTRRGGNLPMGNYSSILINPRNPDEVFLASALDIIGGIFQSVDGGWTWKRVDQKSDFLASRRFWTIMFDPNDPNRIFAGTHSSGIYRLERQPQRAAAEEPMRQRISTPGN